MKRVTRNEVDFSELFKFAEEVSGVSGMILPTRGKTYEEIYGRKCEYYRFL